RDLVDQMNGWIEVDSQLGDGATFIFEVELGVGKPRPVGHGPKWSSRGPLLVVDDDEISRRVLSELLGRFGLEYRTASSGVEALELLEQDDFSAVFMDCDMPSMETLHELDALARRIFLALRDSSADGEMSVVED
ncbi:MAG: response regulator, partial [Myxococcota bacterium]